MRFVAAAVALPTATVAAIRTQASARQRLDVVRMKGRPFVRGGRTGPSIRRACDFGGSASVQHRPVRAVWPKRGKFRPEPASAPLLPLALFEEAAVAVVKRRTDPVG